jgi:hypothetical protein
VDGRGREEEEERGGKRDEREKGPFEVTNVGFSALGLVEPTRSTRVFSHTHVQPQIRAHIHAFASPDGVRPTRAMQCYMLCRP